MFRVTGNGRTGSLLVEYDPLAVTRDALVEVSGLPATESRAGKVPATATAIRAQRMRVAKQGMLASLAAAVVFALAGRERQHVAAGIA
ncbi:MAG TPA: cation transporter, partial [Coriobacteriia bacterium]|nr:cation transporter [Coriobacteriia bacterium]